MWINLSLIKQGQMQNKIRSDYSNQGYFLKTEIFLIKIDESDNFDSNLSAWLFDHQLWPLYILSQYVITFSSIGSKETWVYTGYLRLHEAVP